MQTSMSGNEIVTGAEVQMIGVAENDFGSDGVQIIRRNGLDAAYSTHRHKDWRIDRPMSRLQCPCAGCTIRCVNMKSSGYVHCAILA